MFSGKIDVEILNKTEDAHQRNAVYSLLENLYLEGRILDENYLIFQKDNFLSTFVKVPEADAFENLKSSKYFLEGLQNLKEVNLSTPIFQILGKDEELSESCVCLNSSAFILFTNFLSIQSPIKCFDCGGSIPLYRIPQTEPAQLRYALGWQAEYNACDLLQMRCGFGERFGIKQMSTLESGLTKVGLERCSEISALTGKPCYYYLYRPNGVSFKKEQERKCPSCSGNWLLDKSLHCFDFKCDRCHLLSNIAFSLK